MSRWGPLLGMVYVQVAYAAMFLITRLALTRGMSHYAFVFYRQLIAALAICPLAFCLGDLRRLTIRWRNVGQIFLLALMGISICQNLYYAGLAYTSSTFLSSMNNLQPAITFVLAYLLRLEEVKIKSRRGQAKILGTLLCVGGAMVMTLSKNDSADDKDNIEMNSIDSASWDPLMIPLLVDNYGQDDGIFILGAFFTIVGTLAWSAFLVYQAWIVEEYPSQLTLSGLVSFMGSLQCAVIALSFAKPSALELQWDLQLLTIAYSGIFCAGFGVFITMWCVKEKGPVYATGFNPMSTVLVAILEPLLLHVQLTWSSLTGMMMVIGGLYLFLWGKAQEGRFARPCSAQQYPDVEGEINGDGTSIEESSNQDPLLAKSNL